MWLRRTGRRSTSCSSTASFRPVLCPSAVAVAVFSWLVNHVGYRMGPGGEFPQQTYRC